MQSGEPQARGLGRVLWSATLDLIGGRARLRRQYQQAVTQQNVLRGYERAFVRARRRIAVWCLGWFLVGPILATTAIQQLLLPQSAGLFTIVSSMILFTSLFFVFALFQAAFLGKPAVRTWMCAGVPWQDAADNT